ncbi:hypothetical protein KDW_63010 [Dictyobacter vulcani]|uniref:histidine kinase n=1 Tax=Dictyobacter vulcani TaxID=2607529 RepID=A0A5J4L1H2_9CHLR|nr:ATP-binding protein [Dictyobacter vulcani]GER92139.1 hypothetical protein KDW_63010 [Dictyobacter vulcani]
MRRSDGRELQLSVTGTPLRNDEGTLTGAIMVARDVTMRRQLEQRTHTALEALLLMAENLVSLAGSSETVPHSLLYHLADLTARVLNGKDVVLAVLAFATDQIEFVVQTSERVPLQNLQPGTRLSVTFSASRLLNQLSAGNAVSFDMIGLRPSERPGGQALLIPLRLRGVLIGVMALAPHDPQHRYLADELTLAEAVGKLVALVIERDRLLREREEAVASERVARETSQQMDDFIGIVSHELKTPLTSLRGNIQIAKRQLTHLIPQSDDQTIQMITMVQGLLDRAERQVMAQNRLVNDLVDVTRIRMDKLELQLTSCDLHQIVEETVEDQRRLTMNRTIHVVGYKQEVMVLADPQRVGQVINNYLSNALKYSAEQTPVEVQLEIQGSMVRIAVRDEGPGLSQEVQQHIWERFYRAPGVKVKSGTGVGLGLGLHICRTIIEQQGGTVACRVSWVRDQPSGSRYHWWLPAAMDNTMETIRLHHFLGDSAQSFFTRQARGHGGNIWRRATGVRSQEHFLYHAQRGGTPEI